MDGLVRYINDPDLDERGTVGPSCSARYYCATQGNAWPILNQTQLGLYERDARARAVELIPRQFPLCVRPVVRSLVRKVHRWRARVGVLTGDPLASQQTLVPAKQTLFAIENWSPAELAADLPAWEREMYAPALARHGLESGAERTTVLILRDPWNQLASMLKSPQMEPPRPLAPAQFRSMWLAYAREFSGRTGRLASLGKVVKFNYARWFSELDYRRELARELGWEHSDAGLNTVTDFGGGSSFDNCQYHQRAQAMSVRERWRAYANHPLMQELCDDEELRVLSREIFGEEPPLPRSASSRTQGWSPPARPRRAA